MPSTQKPRNVEELAKWPMYRGKAAYCWKGGWITGSNNGRTFRIPASCGRWDCRHCGAANKKKLWWRVTEGVLRKWPTARFALLTLTYRWKRSGESINRAISRKGDNSPLAIRLQRSPMEWREALTRDWRVLYRRYEKCFGEKLSFFKVIELTKQGAPHHHALIRITEHTDEDWFRQQWADITGDGDPIACADLWSKGTKSRLGFDISTNRLAFNYVFKYIGKSLGGTILEGVPIHQYSKSRDFPLATIVDRGQITCYNEDRGYYQYDINDYSRNYGMRYYYEKLLAKGELTPAQQIKYQAAAAKYDIYDKIRDEKLLKASFEGSAKNLLWYVPEGTWSSMATHNSDSWRY